MGNDLTRSRYSNLLGLEAIKKGMVLPTLALLLLCSCGGQGDGNSDSAGGEAVYHIKLEEGLKASEVIKLSSIGEEVSFFELKAPPDLPLDVKNIGVTGEFIFVLSKGSLYQFDHTGRYIRPIGRRGRGPKEYFSANSINLNDSLRRVFIPNRPSMLIFSYDGSFVDTTFTPFIKNEMGGIMPEGDVLYVGYEMQGYSKYKLLALRGKSDTLYRIPNRHNFKTEMSFAFFSPFTYPFYRYRGSIYYKGFYDNDTVWRVDRTGYRVHAVLDLGRYKRPIPNSWEELFKIRGDGVQGKGDYFRVDRIFEDSTYFYLGCYPFFSLKLKITLLAFDKHKKRAFKVEDIQGNGGITDDIHGGAPLMPQLITDRYLLSVVDAPTFLEQNEGREGLSDRMRTFIATLNENSNPVVVMAKLKNGGNGK